jgi:hypothetical protein
MMLLNEEKLDYDINEFISRLKEGGPRRHIPSATKEAFIHAICLIPEPADRIAECKEVFDKIKEENIKNYQKQNPGATPAEANAIANAGSLTVDAVL